MVGVDEDVHDRQKRVKGWRQDVVANARVLVVGAGALGNEVVKLLLQLGVKSISIVDFDSIVKANLNRCVFFSENDVGLLKADVLKREAKKINPAAEIVVFAKKVEELSEDFFKNFDYAFGCLDNLGARLHLNAQCYDRMPLIDGGTTGFFGKVQVGRAPSSCIECGLSKSDYKLLWQKYNCVGELIDWINPKNPALPTTTSVVAGIQVNEFLKLVHENSFSVKSLAGKFLFLDGLKSTVQLFEVPKRVGCPVH